MRKLRNLSALLLAAVLMVGFAGCPDPDEGGGDQTPEWARGFYNYPAGRVNSNTGRLTINNSLASEVLLFYEKVDKDNYIGTIGSLGSIRVKMPEQKFYAIVAVQKDNYIERKAQASQFHEMAYYSDTQQYTISVSPSSMWGGGNWRFNNYTNFWVEVKKADLSQNYAVIQPQAKSVNIPIEIGSIYDYSLYYSRDLKYNGLIIAKVETTNPKKDGVVQVNAQNSSHVTDIEDVNVTANTKPYVMVINGSSVGIRVFYSATQKTNGAPQGDIIVPGGQRLLFSGFEPADLTTNLNFRAASWQTDHRYVPSSQSMSMQNDKVYEVTIPSGAEPAASAITVNEVPASTYIN
jgi:hypothetical protein